MDEISGSSGSRRNKYCTKSSPLGTIDFFSFFLTGFRCMGKREKPRVVGWMGLRGLIRIYQEDSANKRERRERTADL
jgi:hypothetical protein